jgi:hypothetical protein
MSIILHVSLLCSSDILYRLGHHFEGQKKKKKPTSSLRSCGYILLLNRTRYRAVFRGILCLCEEFSCDLRITSLLKDLSLRDFFNKFYFTDKRNLTFELIVRISGSQLYLRTLSNPESVGS